MKLKPLHILTVIALLPALSGGAQSSIDEKFSVKASADIGLGTAMNLDYALPNINAKSSSSDFGVDFGWTFWQQREHSLEANIGLRYGRTSLKARLSELHYNYSAPAAADMDDEPYIRYYELDDLNQKILTDRLSIPIYLSYHYRINERFSVHALAGMKIGFNVSSKIGRSGGNVFSYGVYPQYDDLLIDASYMNCFGNSTLDAAQTLKPDTNSATFSLLAGVGAEVRIWGPISADITFKYEGAVSNMYKAASGLNTLTAANAPVTYTVADGQQVAPLSRYLTTSKLSRFSCAISLIYRF